MLFLGVRCPPAKRFFYESERNRRVVPRGEPLVEENVVLTERHFLALAVQPVIEMSFDVDSAEVNCRDPVLIRAQTEPHDAPNDVRVDEDQERVIHDLHQGLILDIDRQVSDLLQDFLEALHF